MSHWRKKRVIILTFILIISLFLISIQSFGYKIKDNSCKIVSYNEIVDYGLNFYDNKEDLLNFYNFHPKVEFASLIDNTLTIKFVDGSYKLILNFYSSIIKNDNHSEKLFEESFNLFQNPNILSQNAQILYPSEYLYGTFCIKKIFNILLRSHYNIKYLINQDVNLKFVKNGLNGDIIYFNTHAGYWDVDGDQLGDCVVIGTGEYWTDETKILYPYEYENKMIVEGIVGDKSFVCFTPEFISYNYGPKSFNSSLIYMATCHATYDDSMANTFLDSGADIYMGWTQNTVYWINSKTSVQTFRLLKLGFSVEQTCKIIRYGGLLNRLFQSKLTYFGNGNHKIT